MISSANTAQFLVIKIREVSIFNSKAPNSFHPSDHPWKEPKKVCHRMFYHWFFFVRAVIFSRHKRVFFRKVTFTEQLLYPSISLWSLHKMCNLQILNLFKKLPLLIQIQITTSSGYFFLIEGDEGRSECLQCPICLYSELLSANPLLHLCEEGPHSFDFATSVSVTCVVEICGSFSPRWMPLDFSPILSHEEVQSIPLSP